MNKKQHMDPDELYQTGYFNFDPNRSNLKKVIFGTKMTSNKKSQFVNMYS